MGKKGWYQNKYRELEIQGRRLARGVWMEDMLFQLGGPVRQIGLLSHRPARRDIDSWALRRSTNTCSGIELRTVATLYFL
jgi:hypothetical protein